MVDRYDLRPLLPEHTVDYAVVPFDDLPDGRHSHFGNDPSPHWELRYQVHGRIDPLSHAIRIAFRTRLAMNSRMLSMSLIALGEMITSAISDACVWHLPR